jgi:predicted negative regulator of RcsB-dependent stress response
MKKTRTQKEKERQAEKMRMQQGAAQQPGTDTIPKWMPPELVPVYDWWRGGGKATTGLCAVCLLAGLAVFAWRSVRSGKEAAATEAYVNCKTAQIPSASVELEGIVPETAGMKVGRMVRLSLANSYYAGRKFDLALKEFDGIVSEGAAPDGFAWAAELGKARSLEALARYADAKTAFESLAKKYTKSPCELEANIGAVRTAFLSGGDKTSATNALAGLKQRFTDDVSVKVIDETVDAVVRYDSKRGLDMPVYSEPLKLPEAGLVSAGSVGDAASLLDESQNAVQAAEQKTLENKKPEPAVVPEPPKKAGKPAASEQKPVAEVKKPAPEVKKPVAAEEKKPAAPEVKKPDAQEVKKPAAVEEKKPAAKPAKKKTSKPAKKPAAQPAEKQTK